MKQWQAGRVVQESAGGVGVVAVAGGGPGGAACSGGETVDCRGRRGRRATGATQETGPPQTDEQSSVSR